MFVKYVDEDGDEITLDSEGWYQSLQLNARS